ncbi:unnamed protein product [Gongylonema pulchrum]|uniref:Exported protein n=1 Tax=Gongylonema pulchrum TaxID=637853 RepID=A0A183DV72_9BILA|nr:unnamed protein product [Gongylonema pulchrum]
MGKVALKKLAAIWMWPVIAATLMISDWRTSKRLAESDMGTFTVRYFFKKAIWEKKTYWAMIAVAGYLGHCLNKQGMHKASMMKGHSKMFADRVAQIPKDQDIWKY